MDCQTKKLLPSMCHNAKSFRAIITGSLPMLPFETTPRFVATSPMKLLFVGSHSLQTRHHRASSEAPGGLVALSPAMVPPLFLYKTHRSLNGHVVPALASSFLASFEALGERKGASYAC